MKIIRIEKDLVVFGIEHISLLNDGLLDSLPWPEAAKKAAFQFERPIEGHPGKLLQHISPRHFPRVGFRALPEDLISSAPVDPDSEVRVRTAGDLDMMKSLVRNTVREFFYEPWRHLSEADFPQQIEDFLEKSLTLANTVLIEKRGEPAALMNLMEAQDCTGIDVDHIGWAWVDRRLGPADRRQVRALVVDRLRRTRTKPLHGFVRTFNFPSLNSIMNIGFKPACVHVRRSDNMTP